jgi:hypothetical protein
MSGAKAASGVHTMPIASVYSVVLDDPQSMLTKPNHHCTEMSRINYLQPSSPSSSSSS